MPNEIDDVRKSLEQLFDPARIVPEDHIDDLSPCGRYSLEVDSYTTPACPDYAAISMAEVRSTATGDLIARIKRNDDRWFHGWIISNDGDYLVCSEDLEGQTVIDLRNGQVASYTSSDDPYIWCEFYPSPDRKRLAVLGCYWACPYMIVVYDFQSPMSLPLPKIADLVLGPHENFGHWLDNDRFTLKREDGSPPTIHTISAVASTNLDAASTAPPAHAGPSPADPTSPALSGHPPGPSPTPAQ